MRGPTTPDKMKKTEWSSRPLTIGKRNDKESVKRGNLGRKENRRKHNDLVLKRKCESKA